MRWWTLENSFYAYGVIYFGNWLYTLAMPFSILVKLWTLGNPLAYQVMDIDSALLFLEGYGPRQLIHSFL